MHKRYVVNFLVVLLVLSILPCQLFAEGTPVKKVNS
jgi:hypothetical protein